MSLDSLKTVWDDLENTPLSDQLEDQKINHLLQKNHYTFMKRNSIIDIVLIGFYTYTIILIFLLFNSLELPSLKFLGGITLGILVILLLIRIKRVAKSIRIGFFEFSYMDSIRFIAYEKKVRQKFYLIHITLGFVLSIALPILYVKIYNEYDIISTPYFWWVIIPVCIVYTLSLNLWIKRNYTKALDEAQQLLKSIESI